MKNLLTIVIFLIFNLAFSQVIVGNNVGTVPTGQKSSVLLEFAAGQNKGMILPYLRTLPSGEGLVEGTIILDASNPTNSKIKYYNGQITLQSADGWVDLSSGKSADISNYMTIQPSLAFITEDPSGKVIIGANDTLADGVLVLESDSKAMVLPMVENTDEVPDPAPGMMLYINKAGAKRLAVFNGEGWTYWKP